MSDAVNKLQSWFKGLDKKQQEEILSFLYAGKVLIREGGYIGPSPELINEGLFCGPAPRKTTSNICPSCGRPR